MIVQRVVLSLLLSLVSLNLLAQTPTTFTYQGQLFASGTPANGSFVLRVRPFDQLTNGTALAPSITTPTLNVVNGVFTTTLDFGAGVFLGSPVWIEIEVQAPASSFVLLSPRQPVTPTPYAINAGKLNGLDAAQLITAGSSLIPFSTGAILNGAAVVSAVPILMGFGSNTVATIDAFGESTSPPQAGGFSFAVPADGTLQNLQVSADLLVSSPFSINTIGLQYEFTVIRSPSNPNNGIGHIASPYLSTPLTSSLQFGFPNQVIVPGTFYAATNLNNLGSLAVSAGDRIGIRVRTLTSTDPSASDITQLSFSATLTYARDAQ